MHRATISRLLELTLVRCATLTAGVRLVRQLHGLQMMKATVPWSVCDVYTRLRTVLHAGAAGNELYGAMGIVS